MMFRSELKIKAPVLALVPPRLAGDDLKKFDVRQQALKPQKCAMTFQLAIRRAALAIPAEARCLQRSFTSPSSLKADEGAPRQSTPSPNCLFPQLPFPPSTYH